MTHIFRYLFSQVVNIQYWNEEIKQKISILALACLNSFYVRDTRSLNLGSFAILQLHARIHTSFNED